MTHRKLLAVPAHLLPKPLFFPFCQAQGPAAISPPSFHCPRTKRALTDIGWSRKASHTFPASHFHHDFTVFPLAPSLRLSPSWLPWVILLSCAHRSQPPVSDHRGRAQEPSLHKKEAMGIKKWLLNLEAETTSVWLYLLFTNPLRHFP